MKHSILLAFFAISAEANARWIIDERVDAMSDKMMQYASAVDEKGKVLLTLDSDEESRVWISITFPKTAAYILSDDKNPKLRFDSNPPITLETRDHSWQLRFYRTVFHDGLSRTSGNLRQALNSEKLILRTYQYDGSFVDFSFDMRNSSEVLCNVLKGIESYCQQPNP